MDTVIIPSPGNSGYVELARSKMGRLFRKQILPMDDDFVHPNDKTSKIHIDKAFAQKLLDNFHSGGCDIVQVPIVDEKNQHVEDPLRNMGEVVDLTFDETGVYAVIDARKPEYADELGKTLLGASAMMHLNYEDTKTGDKIGPTLLHVAVTNRPYVTKLDDYREIIAASADHIGDEAPVVLTSTNSPEDSKMDKDQLIAALKEHGIDVEALETQITQLSAKPVVTTPPPVDEQTKELVAALSAVLDKAGAPVSRGDEGEIEIADVAEAVIELSREKTDLEKTVKDLKTESDELKLSAATAEVKKLVTSGRILPTQEEAMLELRLTNKPMFEKLVPDAPLIEMAAVGVDVHDAPRSQEVDKEVERLAKLANSTRSGRKTADR